MRQSAEHNSSAQNGRERKNPRRVGAVIEVASENKVLLVQDIKDKFKKRTIQAIKREQRALIADGKIKEAERQEEAQKIVNNGRYSLPGGKIDWTDYVTAGAEELHGRKPDYRNPEEVEAFKTVTRHAVCREIAEELNLQLDPDRIVPILEIQGGTRDHIICLVQAEGTIEILEDEICGIGFFGTENPIPLKSIFYQAHVIYLYQRYIRAQNRTECRESFLSRLRIPHRLAQDWHENAKHGFLSRSPKSRRKHKIPQPLVSSPNFEIVDIHGEVINPITPPSFTQAKSAIYVPPEENK